METTRTRVTTYQPVHEFSIEDIQLLTIISQAAWLNVEGETQPKTTMSFEQFDAELQAAQEMGLAARRKRLGLENNASESSRDDKNHLSHERVEFWRCYQRHRCLHLQREHHVGFDFAAAGSATSQSLARPLRASSHAVAADCSARVGRERCCSLRLSCCHETIEG